MNRAARNIFVAFCGHVILLLFPFLVRAIMIRKLGIEYLGIGSLFSAILGVLTLTELGFGSAAVYFLYEPVAKGRDEEVNALLVFYRRVFRIIGAVILIAGLLLLPFLDKLISGTCPEDINIYVVYCIQLAGTVISYFFFSYKSVILTATLRNDVESILYTATNAVMYIVQIALLYLFRNYYTYAIVLPVFNLARCLIRSVVCDRMFPQYRCCGEISEELRKSIRIRIAALFGHKLNTRVIQTADSVAISSFLGLGLLGIYSNYFYLFTAVGVLTAMVTNVIRPIVGNYMVCEEGSDKLRIFHNFIFIYAWMITFCCTCFVCLYQHFMTLWVGASLLLPFSSVLLLSLYFWIWQIGEVFTVYRDAAGLWHKVKYYPYVSALVNIVINILLVKTIGLNGVIIATVVTLGMISLPCEIRGLFTHYFRCSAGKTVLLIVQYTLVMSALAFVTYLFTEYVIGGDGVWRFVLKGASCCVVPNLLFALLFRNSLEFAFFKNYLLSKLHRRAKR